MIQRLASYREARRKQTPQSATVADKDIADETTPILPKEVPEKTTHYTTEETVDDGHFNQTYGHKIATYLSKFSFYYPAKDKEPIEVRRKKSSEDDVEKEGSASDLPKRLIYPPSIEEAWNFFEYQCLPRRFTNIQDSGEGRKYVRASLGEKDPTKLYPIIDTPLEDMADFGIGVGMYFKTVRFFGIVTFLAGCISIPTMRYYNSDTYSPGSEGGSGWNEFVAGVSGVCGDQKFQPCPTCPSSNDPGFIPGRMFTSSVGDGDMSFILVNQCELNDIFGYSALASLIFVLAAVYWFVYLQRQYRIRLDEGEQTSSDYSIRIFNPPTSKSAKDPETWKTFFEEKFDNVQVAVCTVAINNESLLNLLLAKFDLRNKLIDMLPLDVEYDEDNLDEMAEYTVPPKKVKVISNVIFYVLFFVLFYLVFEFAVTHSAFYATIGLIIYQILTRKKLTGHQIVEKMLELDTSIAEESAKSEDFKVSDVFVTFETEDMQRVVLKSLKVPGFRSSEVNDELKFEGVILEVDEPDEPSSMRWQDLDVPFWTEQRQKIYSFSLAFLFTIVGGIIIGWARTNDALYSTIAIIFLNAITPKIANSLTNSESHDTETSYAASAYIKITFIRWVYTVIVNFAITPFTNVLGFGQLIESIRILFTAELLQRPILQMLDWSGHLKRHILGPRKEDQRRMNLQFIPDPYSIGERYTEVTKLLFFTFFYAIVFPIGFFYAAATFLVYYWVDKFCVLRKWRQGPKINAEISLYSTYYLWLTVLAYAFVAAYTVSEFPFDNACLLTEDSVPEEYIGQNFKVLDGTLAGTNFTVASDAPVYKNCNQDVLRGVGFHSFPPLPSRFAHADEWMSEPQLQIATLFGWTLVGISIIIATSFILRLYYRFMRPLFQKTWEPEGKASEEGFSDVAEIFAYIPSVMKKGFQFPILLCDVSGIDEELISWDCDYKTYNVIYDVPESHRATSFSTVKDWEVSQILRSPSSKHETHESDYTMYSMARYYLGFEQEES